MSGGEKMAIDLGGQQFRIAPPKGNADRLERAAAIVNEKVAQMQAAGVVGSQRTALLTALDLALDLLGKDESEAVMNHDELAKARTRLDKVIGRIDDAITDEQTDEH